jgi:toxin YoeB
MTITFSTHAWEDYRSWQLEDKKTLQKINKLINEIRRTPYQGSGKPEALKFDLQGLWSRRIDLAHRLVYRVDGDSSIIYSCKYHY